MSHVEDAIHWNNRLSRNYLLGEGYLYTIRIPTFSLNAAANRSIAIVTNVDDPVILVNLSFVIAGAVEHTIGIFRGGVVSGGIVVPQVENNTFVTKDPPFSGVLDDVTIDVPGEQRFLATFNRERIAAASSFLIGKPGEVGYLTVTNNSGSPANFIEIAFEAARIQ